MSTISIANPLYDTVFKFLMEDQRVAQILIGALIGKKVKSLTQTANEIVRISQDALKLLRIDFAAEVEVAKDKYEVVTIEVQKVHLESEIVRFRKYLADQYAGKANKVTIETIKDKDGNEISQPVEKAMPITTIYILGHSTIDKTHPVIYNEPKYVDAANNVIEGIADCEFLTNLTHKIIVVQVPSLNQKPKTKVEKFLRIFNQQYKAGNDNQILNIDNQADDNPKGYQEILNRLVLAAASEEIRKEMRNEDDAIREIEAQWFKIQKLEGINKRQEDEIENQKQELAQQKQELEQKNKEFAQQKQELEQKNKEFAQQKQELEQKNKEFANILSSMGLSIKQIAEKLNISENATKELLK